ncbi:MAG TPA: deoxyribonuclease IV [Fimbriimonadaceae bacterium]|nr:deoxyribonuclease IV [Fimbriimonadaceae bacterium]HRJ33303.1 deoxyribonuclease IV [Fimbriimonadaceae bacterium]
MTARLLGAHMPTAGGLHKALERGQEIGCTAIQIFTHSPQQWASKPLDPAKVQLFRDTWAASNIQQVVSHDSYLINLAHPTPEGREKSRRALLGEMQRCHELGVPQVVSHMGSHLGQGEDVGLQLVADEVLTLLTEAPSSVTILMETTAGQGSSLNYKFEHLAKILDLTRAPSQLGICLDTCHIFAAGYDLRTREAYEQTMDALGRIVGFDRLGAIHCNDSKKPLGSRVDRHEHLGEGEIGPTAFECLMADERFFGVPILLETPDAETQHEVNLARLWKWASESDEAT